VTLPNFIVIGPGKTGTTWLYDRLCEHPQVFLARHTKETVFFTEFYERGLGWYEKFFAGSAGAVAAGEVSNTYFFSPEAPARIARHLPHAKLIVLLRNPVERVLSLYLFRRRNGHISGSLEDAIAQDSALLSQNFYDEHLTRYLTFFPREQIFVGLFDDLREDPAKLMRSICSFLGLDAPATIPSADIVLRASTPRHARSFHALKRFAVWLRRRDCHRLLTWGKTNRLLLGILTKPIAATPQLHPLTRERLTVLYRPHIANTAAIIGRDLSGWM
jgi:Sulfotransferase domain